MGAFSWVRSAMCRGGEWPTSESGSGLDSETHPPWQKSRVDPRGSGGKSQFQPFSSNNSSGHLMRKAVFFVLTVKYVLRLIPPSKVYIISGLNYFCTVVAPSFHKPFSLLWFGTWRTSKDPELKQEDVFSQPVTLFPLSALNLYHWLVCRDMRGWNHPGRTRETKALSSNNHSKSVINPWFESWSSPQTRGLTGPSIRSLERKQLGFDQYFKPNQWGWVKVNSELRELFHIVGSLQKRLLWAPQPGESATSQLCLLILMASTGTNLKGISRRWHEVTPESVIDSGRWKGSKGSTVTG